MHLAVWVLIISGFLWLGISWLKRLNSANCLNNTSPCLVNALDGVQPGLLLGIVLISAAVVFLVLGFTARQSFFPVAAAQRRPRAVRNLERTELFQQDYRGSSSEPEFAEAAEPAPSFHTTEQSIETPWSNAPDPAEERTHIDLLPNQRFQLEHYLDRLSHSRIVRSRAEATGIFIRFKITHPRLSQMQERILNPETLLQGGGLIGRHPNCDIVLGSPEVSRVHGRILYRSGQFYFTDLGSTGGSLLNQKKAQTNRDFLLQTADRLRIGRFTLVVDEVNLEPLPDRPSEPETSPIQRLIFKVEELRSHGIPMQGASEFTFQGKQLIEGLSLSKRFRQRAMELWQAELDAGKFCLFVEYPDHFTLWLEKQEPS